MAIIEAFDQQGKLVAAEAAIPGQDYLCPRCQTVMRRKVSAKGMHFFACLPGRSHSDKQCQKEDKQKTSRSLLHTDMKQLIAKWSEKPQKQPILPAPSPSPGPKTPRRTKDNPDIIQRPIDLKDLCTHNYIYRLHPDTPLKDGLKASDSMYLYSWRYMIKSFKGGYGIMMARAMHLLPGNKILLKSWWTNPEGSKEEQIFRIDFDSTKDYVKYASLLFPKRPDDKGFTRAIRANNDILVAGNWTRYDYRGQSQLKCQINNPEKQIFICPLEQK